MPYWASKSSPSKLTKVVDLLDSSRECAAAGESLIRNNPTSAAGVGALFRATDLAFGCLKDEWAPHAILVQLVHLAGLTISSNGADIEGP